MKRLLLIFCVLVLLIVPVNAAAQRVMDNADLLNNDRELSLLNKADAIALKYQMDVAIVTVETTGYKTVQAYADDYYDFGGYGFGDDNSGILFLLCMDTREFAFSTCGKAISVINDGDLADLEEKMLPDLRSGNYAAAFDAFLDGVEAEYQSADPTSTKNILIRIGISLLVGLVVALIVIAIMRSRMNTARMQHDATNYMADGSYDLFRCHDIYLYSHTSRTRKSSSTTHSASSGRSHGGRSGRF